MNQAELLTADSLFEGRLTVRQYRKGYRFSLDAVLLAGLTRVTPEDNVMDLGTGCGVVALILAHQRRGRLIVGIELQPELADLARRNVVDNGFEKLVKIEEMDYRHISSRFPPESFDLVVANPPYRRLRTGKMNSQGQKARARHEITGSVRDVFAAGKYLLRAGGRMALIYPATRLVHLLVTAVEFGFAPKELVMIHSSSSSPGRLVHVESRKAGGEELRVTPPFSVYTRDGSYTEEMQRLFAGETRFER